MIKTLYLKLNTDIPLEKFKPLFPKLSIFSEIYVFIEDLKNDFSYLLSFIKALTDLLERYYFCQNKFHLVHYFLPESRPFYSILAKLIEPFNLEGYTHQITPRLILFPLLIDPPSSIEGLLDFFEKNFMPPGILIKKKDYNLISKNVERLFLLNKADPLLSLGFQEAALNTLEKINESGETILNPCPSMLVIDKNGYLYPCLYAYKEGLSQGSLLKDDTLPFTALDHLCPTCKYEALTSLENTPLISKEEFGCLHFRLGLSYFKKEKLTFALDHFLKALEFVSTKEKGDIYFYLALSEANLGRYELAINYLNKTNIKNYNSYFYLGFCYFNKKDYLRAAKALKKALLMDPPPEDRLSIVLYLASAYKEIEDFKKAISLLKDLLPTYSKTKQIYNILGTCYYKTQQFSVAARSFETAIKLDPTSAIDYANLGLSLKAMGEREKARFYCQKALDLDSSLDFVKEALGEL
jgi:tetratricopeptide (TPR) repeat protein